MITSTIRHCCYYYYLAPALLPTPIPRTNAATNSAALPPVAPPRPSSRPYAPPRRTSLAALAALRRGYPVAIPRRGYAPAPRRGGGRDGVFPRRGARASRADVRSPRPCALLVATDLPFHRLRRTIDRYVHRRRSLPIDRRSNEHTPCRPRPSP